ncbi:MAG: phosphopantothenoylcysteine decarboxylase, partial [Acidimicrobiia bacterium]
ASVAARTNRPFLVGFAAETGDLTRVVDKAQKKKVDLLVANDVTEDGAGFAVDTNRVTIVTPDGRTEPWPMMSKTDVARRI